MVKCEKCGAVLDALEIGMFCIDGSDIRINVAIEEADEDAVIFETNPNNWTDYDLSEEEKLDGVLCPHCKQFPFKNREIQVYDIVRCVCFKTVEPTKPDTAEVIRCKDCKHFYPTPGYTQVDGMCNLNHAAWKFDSFCSAGERKV